MRQFYTDLLDAWNRRSADTQPGLKQAWSLAVPALHLVGRDVLDVVADVLSMTEGIPNLARAFAVERVGRRVPPNSSSVRPEAPREGHRARNRTLAPDERPLRGRDHAAGDAGADERVRVVHGNAGIHDLRDTSGCAKSLPSRRWSPRPPRFTHAWPAYPAQRRLRILLRTVEAARVHHPEVTEREVVLDRIVWIEATERGGDIAGHGPTGACVPCQAQTAAHADHMRVEGHHEFRRGHARPDAKVQRVAPDHPTQEQVQPLAGTSSGRPREKVADAWPAGDSPVCRSKIERERTRREAVQGRAETIGRIKRVWFTEDRLWDLGGGIPAALFPPNTVRISRATTRTA